MSERIDDWSVRTWRERHDRNYFGTHPHHREWGVYDHYPAWLSRTGKITPDADVLEIGCGYGEWMIPLASHVHSVTGCDIHVGPLEKARQLFAERNVTNATVVQSDGTTLPFPANSFDVVYSISVFQHIPRVIVEGYLRESARVLRPGGAVAHHFRRAGHHAAKDIGPGYNDDRIVTHMKDYSVGWTSDEVREAEALAGFTVDLVEDSDFVIAIGKAR